MAKTDFVITWVDSKDEAWQKERSSYAHFDDETNGEIRYRDLGLLKYWFRSIEKNASWVNRIFLVTNGHYPVWLNKENSKLVLIKHSDYIPDKYLPTFNSNVIELFFNRIQGLNEQFVYFNDDTFMMSKMTENDFFIENKPRDTFAWNAVSIKKDDSCVEHIILNDLELLSKYFEKKAVQRRNVTKMLNLQNGKSIYKTIALYPWKYFTGIENPHVAQSYLKSNLDFLWSNEEKELLSTAENRFRDRSDYSLWLARYLCLFKGDFIVKNRKKELFYELKDDNSYLYSKIREGLTLLCINDSSKVKDFEKVKKDLIEHFDRLFPEKSSFEL